MREERSYNLGINIYSRAVARFFPFGCESSTLLRTPRTTRLAAAKARDVAAIIKKNGAFASDSRAENPFRAVCGAFLSVKRPLRSKM